MMGSNSMEVNLSGKTALVTGASSGIGAAVATALAANGATVWVNHPDEATAESAEAVVTSISESGGAAQTIQADVSSESDVLAMFSTLGSGPLDILVNNAGIAHSSPVETLDVEDFDRLIGVHLRGTFLCTRSALKMMYAQNSGRIINTASQLVLEALSPNFSPSQAQSLVESPREYTDVETVTATYASLGDSVGVMAVRSEYFLVQVRATVRLQYLINSSYINMVFG